MIQETDSYSELFFPLGRPEGYLMPRRNVTIAHRRELPHIQLAFTTMTSQDRLLGVCPNCDAEIRVQHVLIEYREDDETGIWADCPNCSEVVYPQ